mgnify:CR=1 FL=1|jgi:uncharacterized protein (UPF0335 family)
MAAKKKKVTEYATGADLETHVKEFLERLKNIDNEIEMLGEDRKALQEEFSDRIDMKTMKKAMSVAKIKSSVDNKGTFDEYSELIESPTL